MAKPKSKPQLSLDVAAITDNAAGIGPDHWSRHFFAHIFSAFDDGQFAGTYEEDGRYPISPRLLACVTTLQCMFKVSDHQAVEDAIVRRDWRIALGVTSTMRASTPPCWSTSASGCDHGVGGTRDIPVESLRLKLFRWGAQVYEYCKLLEAAGDSSFADAQVARMIAFWAAERDHHPRCFRMGEGAQGDGG